MFPRRPRRGPGRRLSTRILASQVAILAVTSVIGFVLFAWAQRAQLDNEYEQRALSIAQVAASDPQIVAGMTVPGSGSLVQAAAERIAHSSRASYVVVIDLHGVRHSHPYPELIGQRVSEPIVVLDGQGHTGIDPGATGRSANGKAPLFGPSGSIIGEVSVGIPEHHVAGQLWRELPTFALYAGIALGVGCAASYALARRLKRSTFGLELEEIAGLLQDREAMLHGIREGVIAFDPRGNITVVNDEARRLLQIDTALGLKPADVFPEGRLRDALDGTLTGTDLTVLTDRYCLVVNRMPVGLRGHQLGAVVTVRDRTEMVGLLRELDSVRGLTDALRAQQHEFANRMHILAGLLDLGEHEAAFEFAVESAGAEPALTESVRQRIGSPLMVGLIVAKSTVAAERGVRITLTEDSQLGDQPTHLRGLLTIVGNLLDNAVDAAVSGTPAPGGAQVRLSLVETPSAITLQVADSGPGVPPEAVESIFEDGWSTRPDRGTARRGLGLALVHRLVRHHGGTITVGKEVGAVFTVTLPLSGTTPAGAVGSSPAVPAARTTPLQLAASGGDRW
ncbi:two-component system CitB family sensor kinase [Streptomyces sp. 846.5]|nr:sensor histidine kinase [Streptomyces sp. 846.5]TDU04521.1 two-component system CitB family sensor kinase [Streptomyces sp. 846.5]